jgi:hypothetical protein
MRLTLFLTALLISSCAIKPPKPTLCIHVQEDGYFRCKNIKTDKKFDLSYEQAERYIAISPDDYNEILDFIDAVLKKSGVHIEGY